VTDNHGDPQTILHQVYSAVIQGNFDALGEAVTDDVELNICGFGPMHGTWRGRKEVVEATRRNFALVASQQPEIEGMISQGNCVAVLLRETGVFLTETFRPPNVSPPCMVKKGCRSLCGRAGASGPYRFAVC